MQFIYHGECDIPEDQLPFFLEAGKQLRYFLDLLNTFKSLFQICEAFSNKDYLRVAGLNTADLAETTIQKKKKRKDKTRENTANPESLQMLEKGDGIVGHSAAEEPEERTSPKRKQDKLKQSIFENDCNIRFSA